MKITTSANVSSSVDSCPVAFLSQRSPADIMMEIAKATKTPTLEYKGTCFNHPLVKIVSGDSNLKCLLSVLSAPYLLFIGFSPFHHFYTRVQALTPDEKNSALLSTKLMVVFDTAPNLFDHGVVPVDVVYDQDSKFVFKYLTSVSAVRRFRQGLLGHKPFAYTLKDFYNHHGGVNDYLREVIHRVKTGSFLTPFMTFIYRLPYSTHQKPVKDLIANWMFYSGDPAVLMEALSLQEYRDPPLRLSPKMVDALSTDILTLPILADYLSVFARLQQDNELPYIDATRNCGVTVYEINYLVSLVNAEPCLVDLSRCLPAVGAVSNHEFFTSADFRANLLKQVSGLQLAVKQRRQRKAAKPQLEQV